MDRKEKLAECILVEIESLLKETEGYRATALSEQIIRDALALAMLVKEEIKEVA